MHSCPPIPEDHSRIKTIGSEYDRNKNPIILSTACWRRYVGMWEIRNQKLYLVGISGKYKLEATDPLFAEWFTGKLIIPRGEMLQYIHAGFASIYEEELHLGIDKGVVINTSIINNKFRKFDEYNDLKELAARLSNSRRKNRNRCWGKKKKIVLLDDRKSVFEPKSLKQNYKHILFDTLTFWFNKVFNKDSN